MDLTTVARMCHRLSPFQLQMFIKMLGPQGPAAPRGSDLFLWTADHLATTGLLDQDRLRIWMEVFGQHLFKAHEFLTAADDIYKAPVIKIGFLDRTLAVMDGVETFLNLETGTTTSVVKGLRPCETITYDLAAIYARYTTAQRLHNQGAANGPQKTADRGQAGQT